MIDIYENDTKENEIVFNRESIESVSLLSMEEYKNNKDEIPLTKSWWWIKSPGTYKKNVMYVFFDGEIYTEGYKADSERAGVRPVFYLNIDAANVLNRGDKVRIGKYQATVLDNGTCLLDEVVCNHRFDVVSNNWETSELKQYMESNEFMDKIFDN